MQTPQRTRIAPDGLRWTCDPAWLDFRSTDDLEPITHVVGQDDAIEALRFGLEIRAPGQNIFVRGLAGSGRLTLLRHLLEEARLECEPALDRCYVHDFHRPDRPRLVSLPRGRGKVFRQRVDQLVDYLRDELVPAITSEVFRKRRDVLQQDLEKKIQGLVGPFEQELEEHQLALVSVDVGSGTRPAIVPKLEGEPVSPEQFEQLVKEGKVATAARDAVVESIQSYGKQLEKLSGEIERAQEEHKESVRGLLQKETRALLKRRVDRIRMEFPEEGVRKHLQAIVDDVVDHRLPALGEGKVEGFSRRYRVNVVIDRSQDDACPVVAETAPNVQNLLGTIDREPMPDGGFRNDHLLIRAGALLRADGGFLLLEARDVLEEPGAWRALTRALRTEKVDMIPPEQGTLPFPPGIQPEAAEVEVKVILIGDPELYYGLDSVDPDFPQLFKVLADFETTLPREKRTVGLYAGVLAKIVREESLLPFDASAVGALAEQGARIASRSDKLTTRFGRLADIAREASFRVRRGGGAQVDAAAVSTAVSAMKRRADLPSRRFRRLVAEGTLRVETQGEVVGQVNGLAVVHAGPLTYGFPARITATIGAGSAGAINIEREAQLSGAIHTKGFYILGGLLRHLLRTKHPLAFSASIAFEQSYGGIDGDSASGGEMCCLLSAITGVPLRQDLAMTGAIDQLGHVQAIGAVNEKIEGFYDTCSDIGLTGAQGVIIPRSNAVDLMLREDVVQACREGRFHVYAVGTIGEAMEIFTGMPMGEMVDGGEYPEGTLLRRAVDQAHEYWKIVAPDQAPGSAAIAARKAAAGSTGKAGDDAAPV